MIFFYVKKNHDPLLYKGKNYNPLMAEKNNEPHPIGPLFWAVWGLDLQHPPITFQVEQP